MQALTNAIVGVHARVVVERFHEARVCAEAAVRAVGAEDAERWREGALSAVVTPIVARGVGGHPFFAFV